ncbi:MAG: hypothetical protein ACRDYA_16550 [Egibacteraceae bacterium]
MTKLEAILRWVGLAVAWLVKGEQGYWGPRLARRVVRAAVLLVPCSRRERYREEWLAELEKAIAQGGGLTFALLEVMPAAPVVAARELCSVTDWNRAVDPGLAYGLGLGCSALGVGAGARLGALAGGDGLPAAIGMALGLCPGLWLASVLGARRPSWRAPEVGGFLGAVLGMELGGLVGLQRGGGLAALAGLAVGPVVGGVLLSWGAAATDVWLGITTDAELTSGSAHR